VRKIADEHGARVRIGNLHADGTTQGPVRGAQVSLSFSRLIPATQALASNAGSGSAATGGEVKRVH
jgi:hypothetical protein